MPSSEVLSGGSAMKKVACEFLVVLTLVGIASVLTPAWGQEVTASIVGTVTDSSSAPINGAVVTARDTERGTVWTATTRDAGAYSITLLPVGTYDVKVTAPGFQTAIHPPFVLVLDQTARVDVQMKVGKISETVEVTGAAPILQTQSTEVSTLIDANTNVSLPLASRNYLQLTLLAPGVTNVDPDGMRTPQSMTNSGRPYINGNREQANEYLIDGILNSEDKNNEVGYTPGIDAIQEFNLITQNASAEFGNYQGGVVSVSTKSGTNRFHGDLFEFFRNDALDANIASAGWTEGVKDNINNNNPGFNAQGIALKPELRYNQFGGTIGGPIIKDKLFFFADYQGQRLVNAGQTGAQLLTAQARSGDFGQLCTDFGGAFNSGLCTGASAPTGVTTQLVYPSGPNIGQPIPNNNLAAAGLTEDPVASNILGMTKYYPLPQANTLATNNYFYNSGNHLNNNQGDLKIDYNISQKDHVFGRWSQMDLTQPTFTGCVFCNSGASEGSDEPVRNAVVNWTHALSSNLLNEARVGFNAVRFDEALTPTSSLGDISQTLGITGGNAEKPGLVQINITGSNGGSAGLGLQNLIQVFHDTQAQVEDNLIFTHGRHQLKVGFQYVRERQNYIYAGNDGALGALSIATATGSGLADFWLGNVAGGTSSPRDFGGQVSDPAELRGSVFGVFGQDDWRVTNNITVNLGLRFEDHTPLAEIDNRAVNFGLYTGTIYTATGVDGTTKFSNQALYNNYTGIGDWLPRVGVSWAPERFHGKTVIRAGFGISEFMEGGGSNEELNMNLPFGVLEQYAAGGIGTLSNGFGGSASSAACPQGIVFSCYAGNRIRVFDQNFKPAMIDQWNFTIQQQLSNSLTFQVGYVGQRGAHLLNFEDLAQSVPLDAAGKIAGPGDPIVTRVAGPYLGGGTPGSLYLADNGNLGGAETLAGANMSNSDQKYNALQAVLQKRMSNGLEGQIAYTFSKCMSNSPGYFGTGWGSTGATSSGGQPGWENIYNPRLDWGPCYYDQKHILTSYVTYQLPFGHGKQFGHDMTPALNAVLGNWEIGAIVTLHSGNALTLNNFGGWGPTGPSGNSDNTNGIDPQTLAGLPDCNGPVKVVNQKVNAASGAYIQYIDPSASNVTPAAPNTFGTCTVGNVRGPGYANFDLSLHKAFSFTETKRLEFRFEALNAFNHPVWDFSGGPAGGSFDPGTYYTVAGQEFNTNPTFGRITGSQGARELQFALKFYF
jgi:hypothetical protein